MDHLAKLGIKNSKIGQIPFSLNDNINKQTLNNENNQFVPESVNDESSLISDSGHEIL